MEEKRIKKINPTYTQGPENAGEANHEANPEDRSKEKKQSFWERSFWILVSVFSFAWIFIPEFTDVFPIIGWLDEGFAAGLFMYALSMLGIHIPLLSRFVHAKAKSRKGKKI